MPYFESRLRVDFKDLEQIKNALNFCKELGINYVILESNKDNQSFSSKIKKQINSFNIIKTYFRSNLTTENLNDFKKIISKSIYSSDIISVESLNKHVLLQAAKDSRVDIISYSNIEMLKTMSPGIISLTKQNNSFIEFSLAPVFVDHKAIQSKNLRLLYRRAQLALSLNANHIINGNFKNLFEIRHPRGLISICVTLLGLPIHNAKKAFGLNVKAVIERAQRRYSQDIYESGVQLIKKRDESW